MALHRSAGVLAGAVVLAALVMPGSAAAPTVQAVAAVPTAAAPAASIGPVASWNAVGAVFRIALTYTCPKGSTGSANLEAHQNVGGGFVANGFGYSRTPLTCDGRKHTVMLTVSPTGERGMTRGAAYVIADVTACTARATACSPTSVERTVTVR
jgi:hypothetical protein